MKFGVKARNEKKSMKTFLILLLAGSALAAGAQPTNAPAAQSQPFLQTQAGGAALRNTPTLQQAKANEIVSERFIYSGIVVEAVKTRSVLQLVNPFAPPEYGSPEDNIDREPIHGRLLGLKLFCFQFSSRR